MMTRWAESLNEGNRCTETVIPNMRQFDLRYVAYGMPVDEFVQLHPMNSSFSERVQSLHTLYWQKPCVQKKALFSDPGSELEGEVILLQTPQRGQEDGSADQDDGDAQQTRSLYPNHRAKAETA